MQICDICIRAIESRGENVVVVNHVYDEFEEGLTCEWCEETGFDTLYKVKFR